MIKNFIYKHFTTTNNLVSPDRRPIKKKSKMKSLSNLLNKLSSSFSLSNSDSNSNEEYLSKKHTIQQESSIRNYFLSLNQFAIYETVGNGIFGKVCRAKHIPTDIYCALKFIKLTKKVEIEKGLEIAKSLDHTNIVKTLNSFYCFYQGEDYMVIVMEYIEGEVLSDLPTSHFTNDNITQWTKDILQALKYLHTNDIIHRDIKLENIMINQNNKAILLDMDFCIFSFDSYYTSAQCGTPYYMAPEAFKKQAYTTKYDMWSLGVLIYNCLTDRYPYDADSLNTLKRKVLSKEYDTTCLSPKWAKIVRSLIVKVPSLRRSASDMIKMLY